MTHAFFPKLRRVALRSLMFLSLFALAGANIAEAQVAPCGTTVLDLTAGQTIPAGTVTILDP